MPENSSISKSDDGHDLKWPETKNTLNQTTEAPPKNEKDWPLGRSRCQMLAPPLLRKRAIKGNFVLPVWGSRGGAGVWELWSLELRVSLCKEIFCIWRLPLKLALRSRKMSLF